MSMIVCLLGWEAVSMQNTNTITYSLFEHFSDLDLIWSDLGQLDKVSCNLFVLGFQSKILNKTDLNWVKSDPYWVSESEGSRFQVNFLMWVVW